MENQTTKPALARITTIWFIIGFSMVYYFLQPQDILGYIGFVILGFIASNILPGIASTILGLFGIPSWTITNIGRDKNFDKY